MIIIYLTYNVFCFILGKNTYKTWYNPISLYALVWGVSVGLHECGLIAYHPLSAYCWFVIFSMQTFFCGACLFGKRIKREKFEIVYDNDILRSQLKKYIIITTIIAGIAIVGNLLTVISIYGHNLLGNVTNIYADRVYQIREIETIPYLGAFIFITMPLSGIYLKKYGFSLLIIPSFVLAFASALTSGGRAGIVFDIVLFGSAYFITEGRKNNTSKLSIQEKNKLKRRRALLYISVAILLVMVIVLTNRRNAGITLAYATDLYKNTFGKNILVYKIVEYFSSPVGVLNEYLNTSELHFGQNTFLPIFNILSKVGLAERIEQYQEFFMTPIYSNVGTWLRELIEDFTYLGAMIGVFLFGSTTSFQYCKAKEGYGYRYVLIASVLMMIVFLSFFDWKFRTTNMWIAIIFGAIIGYRIDKRSVEAKNG